MQTIYHLITCVCTAVERICSDFVWVLNSIGPPNYSHWTTCCSLVLQMEKAEGNQPVMEVVSTPSLMVELNLFRMGWEGYWASCAVLFEDGGGVYPFYWVGDGGPQESERLLGHSWTVDRQGLAGGGMPVEVSQHFSHLGSIKIRVAVRWSTSNHHCCWCITLHITLHHSQTYYFDEALLWCSHWCKGSTGVVREHCSVVLVWIVWELEEIHMLLSSCQKIWFH